MEDINVNKIRNIIAANFKINSEKLKHPVNNALMRSLQREQNPNDTWLAFIFRGNDRLHFSSRISDKDLMILCELLQEYAPLIYHIDFSFNEIGDEGLNHLSQLVSHCPQIQSLNLMGNSIDVVGAQFLAQAIKDNLSLRYINLFGNKIKTDGCMNLVEILFKNKNLYELNLGDNEINHDGIIVITSVLNWNNQTLGVLNLDKPFYTSIGQETAIHFAKMLQSNRSIEQLSIQKHDFTCEAIYTITEHLLENNQLLVLDLSANQISFKGCEALAQYLCGQYCVLESLILASNRTGHYGAKAISQALSKNRTLIHLDMTRNDIDDNGLQMIAESLETNEKLVSLKLYWNHFGQASLQEFHQLRKNRNQVNLYWDFETYIVDQHIEMAYIDTFVPYDVNVSRQYYQ